MEIHCLSAGVILFAVFLVSAVHGRFSIDSDFPGGNATVKDIQGDDVYFERDRRDSTEWFYWAFRVTGARGRTITFHNSFNHYTVQGAAVSRDGGLSWHWLGPGSVKNRSFQFEFGPEDDEVLFSMGMPYQEAHLNNFLQHYKESPYLREEMLCRSPEGRTVERLHLGCVEKPPQFRVLLTARHHACEMMASYSLEGLMEAVLGESDAGLWLRENVEFLVIPFVDKDGVEDGDPGKNRIPHDHAADYKDNRSIYHEVAAIKQFVPQWSRGRMIFALDMHCPGLRGHFHEMIMTPYRLRGRANWKRTKEFLSVLESVQTGPLTFLLSDSQEFVGWGKDPVHPPSCADERPDPAPWLSKPPVWMQAVAGVETSFAIEIPYGIDTEGNAVDQGSAKAFGHDLATALYAWLKEKEPMMDEPVGSVEPETLVFQHGHLPEEDSGVQDAYFRSDYPDASYGDCEHLLVGTSDLIQFRGLLQFDLSPLQKGGASVAIDSMMLRLYNRGDSNSVNENLRVELHALETGISEETSTWNDPGGEGAPDAVAGGKRSALLASAAANPSHNDSVIFGSTAAFVEYAQEALRANGELNLLVKVAGEDESGRRLFRFCSSDYPDPAIVRPWLSVTLR